ncbi:hypothetical protein ABZ816_34085 [Actinosynnema sp. NPDC047251]|uniref:Putative secreted protein n=1 Tax=Saccharothrix espanaensis (strain ATCC 51144 / DSM 44229 / JCM 9112 / NBRC 15066 / NRRL 15764) TaxID=1179773 RepID=K0K6R4_SACES|nr:hypothetical protein [Saccharothrix espanaensis]CCH32268.1 putative secreted protein [Saccharothrix espanaensis DSM 44229]
MSIIRRALLIVPASLAAIALSGTAAQADPGDVVFGDGNEVTNSNTTNNLVSIDDSFNNVSVWEVTVDIDDEWGDHGVGDQHPDDGPDDWDEADDGR